jgi:hypothetical protein
LVNLADCLESRRKAEPAGVLWAEALYNGRRIVGDDHTETLDAMDGLGRCMPKQKRFDEAQRLLRRCQKTRKN